MHDAPLRRKGRSVGTGRVLGGEDSAWRWGWVSGLHGVLTQRMRVHRTPYMRRAGAKSCVRGAPRTTNAAGGLLSSTIRRRQRLVDGHKLVDTQVDVQNVKKLGAGQEKGASG